LVDSSLTLFIILIHF